MKKVISRWAIFFLLIFPFHSCSFNGNKAEQTAIPIVSGQAHKHFWEHVQDSGVQNFSVSIGNSNDSVIYLENGKVYLMMIDVKKLFDITQIHQQHRLLSMKRVLFDYMSKPPKSKKPTSVKTMSNPITINN